MAGRGNSIRWLGWQASGFEPPTSTNQRVHTGQGTAWLGMAWHGRAGQQNRVTVAGPPRASDRCAYTSRPMHVGYIRFLAGLAGIVAAVWVGAGQDWGAVALGAGGATVVVLEVVAARGRPAP